MGKAKAQDESQPSPLLPRIHTVRKHKVMLDSELAALFGVETKVFNQAIRRNAERFPADFAFKITAQEVANLRSQIVTSNSEAPSPLRSQNVTLKSHGGLRYLPRVFTEHGAIMAAMVLRSEHAVAMSVFVVRAFVQMREQISSNLGVLRRLAEIDKKTPRTRLRASRGRRAALPAAHPSARGRGRGTQNRIPQGQPLNGFSHFPRPSSSFASLRVLRG